MNPEQIHAILRDLGPSTGISKLEPCKELIRALRHRRVSYARIAAILQERCGLAVATSTVHNFVKVRTKRRNTMTMLPEEQPVTAARAVADPMDCTQKRPTYRFNLDV
jgi:hypothetical protein